MTTQSPSLDGFFEALAERNRQQMARTHYDVPAIIKQAVVDTGRVDMLTARMSYTFTDTDAGTYTITAPNTTVNASNELRLTSGAGMAFFASNFYLRNTAGAGTAELAIDGNIHGSVWGGWLSNYLSGFWGRIDRLDSVINGNFSNPSAEGLTINGSNPRLEFHVPAAHAKMFYLAPDGWVRLAVSNGAGGASGEITRWNGGIMVHNGEFEATGNVIAYSDVRLKDKVRKTGGLDAISKLTGVKWRWKRDGKKGAGLLAQDVKKVCAAAVKTGDDGMLGLNYNGVIGLLVNAVNELNGKLKEAQCQIRELSRLMSQ